MNDDVDEMVFEIEGCGEDMSVADDGQCVADVYGKSYEITDAR